MNAANNKFNQTNFQTDVNLTNLYKKGEQLADLGNYAQALTCFEQAIAIQPQSVAAWVFRGVVLIHLERYKEALASCDRALSILPTDRQAWLFRGAALNHLGWYKQSYISYDKALGIQRQSLGQKLTQIFKGIFKYQLSMNNEQLSINR